MSPAGTGLRALLADPDALRRLHAAGAPVEETPEPSNDKRSGEAVELSPAQEQIWFFEQLVADSTFHLVPLVFDVDGPLDVAALQRALDSLVARWEPLRTAVRSVDEQPVARVCPAGQVGPTPLDRHDLSAAADPAAAFEELLAAELRRPLDLGRPPLVRASLARLAADRHRLVVTVHHLAADGHSLRVVQRHLLAEYAATGGAAPDGPAHSDAYYDVARRAAAERADRADADLDHWRRTLAEPPDPIELPSTRAGSPVRSFDGDVVPFEIPEWLWARVRRFAADAHATPYQVLLTAFVVLLHRVAGVRDLVVGSPTAGRDDEAAAGLVGHFVNPLPLRFRLPRDPTWLDVLDEVRGVSLDGQQHRRTPFLDVVRALAPERRLDTHPVFQVVFGWVPELDPPSTVAGVRFAGRVTLSRQALYDLEFQVGPTETGAAGLVRYRTGLLERRDAGALARLFVTMLDQFSSDADQPLVDLRLLADAERAGVVRDWNRTTTPYPRDATIVELFQEWVRRTPDAVALEYDGQALTYREVDARTDEIARYLLDRGLTRPTRAGGPAPVAICLSRGTGWVLGALAALKAGAPYLPLDPSYPPDRLAYMRADAGAGAILVDADGAALWRDSPVPVVDLDTIADQPAAAPLPVAGHPLATAYIMYTSGSTGRPKGSAVTHRNVIRLVRDTGYTVFGPGDVVAQASNVSFDAATFEVWGALLNGGRLVGLARDVILDPRLLGPALREHGVDILFLTTSLAMHVAGEAPWALAGLRYFVFGGEQPDTRSVATLAAHPQRPTHLVNGYGPTETTTFAATHLCDDLTVDSGRIPIGTPISNSTMYVLDAYLEPVPAGVVGELHIGGDGVGLGYVGRPGLTADRFVPDHLGERPGQRLYRTGDLARYRPDGAVEYLGRIDRQVKVRGYRIEPAEIEDCIHRSGLVREAAVVLYGGRLVGYVVPAEPGADGPPVADRIRDALRAELPDYLASLPLVAVPRLPLTANGKLDAAALPDPEPEHPAGGEDLTPTQERVAAVWREVLGVERIGAHDNFFDLGGDSIKATRCTGRLNTALGADLPLRLLFEHPTLAQLGPAVDAHAGPPGTAGDTAGSTAGAAGSGSAPAPTGRARRSLADLLTLLENREESS